MVAWAWWSALLPQARGSLTCPRLVRSQCSGNVPSGRRYPLPWPLARRAGSRPARLGGACGCAHYGPPRGVGLPKSYYGRILIQKVLLMGMAVFFVTKQCPSSMGALLQAWSRDCWDLLWSTDSGDQRAAAGGVRGRPPSLARHVTAVQDHCDGGIRALHVPLFADALRTTWIRRLLDPAPQPWKDLCWFFGFSAAPELRRCGEHVL